MIRSSINVEVNLKILSDQKGFVHVLVMLLLIAGLGAGVYLVGQQTNIFPKALESSAQTDKWIGGVSTEGFCNVGLQCDLGNTLAKDGKNTGLYYPNSGNPACQINNTSVTSCTIVNLGATYDLAQVKVDYQMIDSICGDSCSGNYCGTNPGGSVFSSPDKQNWTNVGNLNYSASSTTQTFDTSGKAQYVMVCRGGGGGARSNLAVDNVSALIVSPLTPTPVPQALVGKHLVFADTYRTAAQNKVLNEYLVLGHYDFLDQSRVKINYFFYDANKDNPPNPATKIHNPMNAPYGGNCQSGPIYLPVYQEFKRFDGTYKQEGNILKVKIGSVIHEWKLEDAVKGFYRLNRNYYNANDGSDVIGGLTFSNGIGYGYLSDQVITSKSISTDNFFDKYQGEIYQNNSIKDAAWKKYTSDFSARVFKKENDPDVASYSYSCPIKDLPGVPDNPKIWCESSILLNYDPYTKLLLYINGGHDFSMDGCMNETNHSNQYLGVMENNKITKMVFIEYSYESDKYPIISVGRYYAP